MRRFTVVLLLAAAVSAVGVSGASAGRPNPGPPPQAHFYADWNGGSACVVASAATCTNTASAWWTNAPTVRWVEFDFSCSSDYDGCGPYNPQDILVAAHVNGASSGSANTTFNFTQFTCATGYSFEASFFDARGHFLGYADSGYTGAGYC